MVEGKRQKQVAAVLQDEFNEIFRKLNLNMIDFSKTNTICK